MKFLDTPEKKERRMVHIPMVRPALPLSLSSIARLIRGSHMIPLWRNRS